MQYDQSLALTFIGNCGHDGLEAGLFIRSDQLIECVFDLNVWYHLATDFRETTLPPGDLNEAFVVNERDVTGHIPTIFDDLRRLLRLAEIPFHHVRATDL